MIDEEDNKTLVRSFVKVFNEHNNMSAVDKYYAQDLIQHNLQVGNGSEGTHTTVEQMIAEDNLVMAFLNTTATQTGNTWESRLPTKRL